MAWQTVWRILGYLLGVIAVGSALGAAVFFGLREHGGPARCPDATVARGARCCAEGQIETAGQCRGKPLRCPLGFLTVTHPEPGCTVVARRIRFRGGTLRFSPNDWQARVVDMVVRVGPFVLDSAEVTVHRWRACVKAGMCSPTQEREPGRPVTGITPAQAARFCGFAGGRLPTGGEWLMAAAGVRARRYPWGQTGLVCRRAVYGLWRGPCAKGATGPEWTGLRPDGASQEGLFDLAGNVAEWTVEPGGRWLARGGSFRSALSVQLQSWAAEARIGPDSDIGFRCAYDQGSLDR